jgi:hypothetical protein
MNMLVSHGLMKVGYFRVPEELLASQEGLLYAGQKSLGKMELGRQRREQETK